VISLLLEDAQTLCTIFVVNHIENECSASSLYSAKVECQSVRGNRKQIEQLHRWGRKEEIFFLGSTRQLWYLHIRGLKRLLN
jgi:hypothetical protein